MAAARIPAYFMLSPHVRCRSCLGGSASGAMPDETSLAPFAFSPAAGDRSEVVANEAAIFGRIARRLSVRRFRRRGGEIRRDLACPAAHAGGAFDGETARGRVRLPL